jgi:hypothetical protein
MREMKSKAPSKRKQDEIKKSSDLSDRDYEQMKDYTQEELQQHFSEALQEMVGKGMISPTEYREYSSHINKWLSELLET